MVDVAGITAAQGVDRRQPDGMAIQPDGMAIQPDGMAIQPDGMAIQPDGMTIRPDGIINVADYSNEKSEVEIEEGEADLIARLLSQLLSTDTLNKGGGSSFGEWSICCRTKQYSIVMLCLIVIDCYLVIQR